MPVPLILAGNTIFYEKRGLPADLETLAVNRLVFEPEIPSG